MKIKVLYDNKFQTLDVDTDEMWVSLSLGDSGGLSDTEKEKRIQDEFDEHFNKPEYNNQHKFYRHMLKKCAVNCDDEQLDVLDLIPDSTDEEERDKNDEYEATCQLVRKYLKPEQADIIIAIHIDKIPQQEYAAMLGITPSAVSQRLKTAEKNFKKYFPTALSFKQSHG